MLSNSGQENLGASVLVRPLGPGDVGSGFLGSEQTPPLCWRMSPVGLGTAVLSGPASKLVSAYSRNSYQEWCPAAA